MNPFKSMDVVRCSCSTGASDFVKEGRLYIVQKCNGDQVNVRGVNYYLDATRFEPVEPLLADMVRAQSKKRKRK